MERSNYDSKADNSLLNVKICLIKFRQKELVCKRDMLVHGDNVGLTHARLSGSSETEVLCTELLNMPDSAWASGNLAEQQLGSNGGKHKFESTKDSLRAEE